MLTWLRWKLNTSLMPFASSHKGPQRIPAERKASTAKREVDQDTVAREESVAESGWSGVSDNSSTDSECTDMEASSIASDQDRFDTAY